MSPKAGPLCLLTGLLAVHSTLAAPNRRLLKGVDPINDVIVFDAPVFTDSSSGSMRAAIPAFVSRRQPNDETVIAQGVSALLKQMGVDVGSSINNLADRVKLFAAGSISGKEVDLQVQACNKQVKLASTDNSGMLFQTADLGNACQPANLGGKLRLPVKVNLMPIDNRQFTANLFPSPPDGFGVISDVDDTIKVSNVLDKPKLLKATFIDDPQPVSGMPQLYSKLQQDLNDPIFFYVTGSPFQLYPFLRNFIDSQYPNGPIMPKNLTFTDIPGAIKALTPDGTLEFKLQMIDRISTFFPKKQFLAIGDSTEKDPETYGQAFRTHGQNFIKCIWIRVVDGAQNDQTRFDAAFQGVPKDRTRLFKDPSELQGVNVASGQC